VVKRHILRMWIVASHAKCVQLFGLDENDHQGNGGLRGSKWEV